MDKHETEELKMTMRVLWRVIVAAMVILIMIGLMVSLVSCQSLPQLFQAAENIATDDAITVEVDRSALQKETDVHISVDVKNKEEPQPFVVHSAPAK